MTQPGALPAPPVRRIAAALRGSLRERYDARALRADLAAGMGQFIEYVPYPVTTGFTAGIAVVIGTLQLKDFLGLTVVRMPEHYLERLGALMKALPTLRLADVSVGVLTLAVLTLWPRINRRIPAPIVALTIAGLAPLAVARAMPGFAAATINTPFSYEVAGRRRPGIP